MRALLILATLLPLMGLIAFYGSRTYIRTMRRRRHIETLERDNARYDEYISRVGRASRSRRRRGGLL